MYVFLIGHPGVGKTRTINVARKFIEEHVQDIFIAPTSMLMASLVDCLKEAKRTVINFPNPLVEFNSLTMYCDEWAAFMHEYNRELIAGMTTFYDVVVPYSQWRRTQDLRIVIKAPQLSLLAGSTPTNLMKFMPEIAWDQGFCSRIMFIYSNTRPLQEDMFKLTAQPLPPDMIHDIKVIHSLLGEMTKTQEYENAFNDFRNTGEEPKPDHPRLTHYNTRRISHLFKLSMVASVDRSSDLILTASDFNRAMGWLLEAERAMPDIFKEGAVSADSKIMDEIYHYIMTSDKGQGVKEHQINLFAKDRVPFNTLLNVIRVMEETGMIRAVATNNLGQRLFKAMK